MKKSKLINFTTQDFVSEKELELKLYRWDKVKDKYIPKLKVNGLLRVVTTKIWNKEALVDWDIHLNMKTKKHIKSVNQFLRNREKKKGGSVNKGFC